MMKVITKDTFTSDISSGVVLVDFYADWCGPCKMIAPVLEELQSEMDTVSIFKVDVDADSELAGQYGVQSIPNMIIFKDGKAVDQVIGFTSKAELQKRLEAVL